jgi:maltooligosyltrehalose trehalohydrolase
MTRFGPLIPGDGVTFRLWAPAAKQVRLVTNRTLDMQPREGGWFELHVPGARAGTHYKFNIDGELDIPDPASHFQPEDVHGPSEVVDHTYDWQCIDWRGRPWDDAVFSEVHVGTYTPEGTFRAIVDRLDHLVETGITALELMPLSDFPGRWNWGYDGVLHYAPDSVYGRPEDLKALVDAAHRRGLMVFLDVVYNHFGPEGNYLHRTSPGFFTQAQTPWGVAIDYESPEVRAYTIENVLHWLEHYRFDGLRFDAVHAIVTRGDPEILADISKAVGAFARETGRLIHLVLENDENRASILDPREEPPAGHFRAQWNDDYHHAWHVFLTDEDAGYYRDYGDAAAHLVRAMKDGFAYQGEQSPHRGDEPRGEPSAHLPPGAFVNFLQNHDQIGNRPRGNRLTTLAKPERVAAALSVLLLQPSPPLLYMGEEWGAEEPFPFFCDFQGDLADAVRQGRKREFAEAYAKHGDEGIPDPLAQSTRDSAVLEWDARSSSPHAERLALTRALLKVRRDFVAPLAAEMSSDSDARMEDGVLTATWRAGGKALHLVANLSDAERNPPTTNWTQNIWGGPPPSILPPWSVYAGLGGA